MSKQKCPDQNAKHYWASTDPGGFCLVYLQSNLFVHRNGPVAEGDGVTEAGLSLDAPL